MAAAPTVFLSLCIYIRVPMAGAATAIVTGAVAAVAVLRLRRDYDSNCNRSCVTHKSDAAISKSTILYLSLQMKPTKTHFTCK